MSPESLHIIEAAVMLGVTAVLIVAFREYLRAASERRLGAMLTRVGLDPALAWRAHGNVTRGLQQRCRSCPREDLCERWLRGDERGSNDFCPNAKLFRTIAGSDG